GPSKTCSRPSSAFALYLLICIALVKLDVVPPLFVLIVKDRWREAIEDTTIMITQLARCEKSMEALWRVDDTNVLMNLVVEGSGRARENTVATLMNLVKNNGDKAI
ncbi:hypothetical protein MUK42_37550, partial [Musa troglodytarum]